MPTPGEELGSIPFESLLGGPLIACVNAQAAAAMSAVNFIKEVGFEKLEGPDEQAPESAETANPIYVKFKYPKEVAPFQPAVPPGKITGLTLVNPGSDYDAGTVNITGGGGSGATATATVTNGAVTGLTLVNPGSGYDAGTVNITGGGGSGATATATVSSLVPAVPADFQVMQLEVPILTMLPIPYLRIEDVTIDFNAKIDSIEYKKVDTSLKADIALAVARRTTTVSQQGWTNSSVKLNVSVAYKRNTQQGESVQRTYSMAVHIKAVQDEMPAGMQKVLDILESNMRSQPVIA